MVVQFVGGELNGKVKDMDVLHREVKNYVPERNEVETYVLVITEERVPTYQYAFSSPAWLYRKRK